MFYFDINRKDDIAWSIMTIFFAMIWGVLTIKYQAFDENTVNINSESSVPLSGDNESMEI
ncbi:hypothetical protein SAMD00019534_115320 [Acytostelium subglobosum LB1]|uniref:hypothetical protein n=1 Tax=Acytostelium subglobosum LB1 TaxID=1410327 RepID=UPI0006450C4E|nr:hypothetical protein SAMD00019534_115320 [Acytostelium subglobosum LB1]GAM28356.1 hypothetical protein SAMD00019534_115320 [Acytostelium subglobosum LB1]|eukprot:XP_012748673.1 hypothetical protein SAMD00019534_115320 [Acytostelium subglobosum LB1]